MAASPNTPERPSSVPRRPWRQFSLRTLLLGMTILAILLGAFAVRLERARRQAAAVAAVQRLDGRACYDFQCKPAAGYGLEFVRDAKSPVPPWLLDRLGVDFFHNVVHVSLGQCRIGDEDIRKLPDFPSLVGLNLWRNRLGDASAPHIARYRYLRWLNVQDTQIGDEGIAEFAKLQSLEKLNLDGTRLTDAGLVHVAQLRNLRELTISSNLISDDGIKTLAPLAKLEILNLQETQVTGETLTTLSAKNSIRELRLDGCPLSNDGALMIGHLPSLRRVTIRSPRVQSLGQIGWPDSLEQVVFEDCQLNDAELLRLSNCPNLRQVSVFSTQVTREGIKRFRKARPNVDVSGP